MWKWLRRKRRDIVSRKKPKLSVQVSEEEKTLVELWARRQGTTVSEFVRDAITRSIPISERRKFESRWKLGEVLDFGEALLDEPALLPAHDLEDDSAPESRPMVLRIPRNHNCAHLDDEAFPTFFNATSCYGTCDHRAQRGRPCFWPPQTSHQCDYFRSARNSDQP